MHCSNPLHAKFFLNNSYWCFPTTVWKFYHIKIIYHGQLLSFACLLIFLWQSLFEFAGNLKNQIPPQVRNSSVGKTQLLPFFHSYSRRVSTTLLMMYNMAQSWHYDHGLTSKQVKNSPFLFSHVWFQIVTELYSAT